MGEVLNLPDLEWIKKLFNSVQAGIVIIDSTNKKIIDMNSAASLLLGQRKEEVVGKSCDAFFCKSIEGCPIDKGLDLEEIETTILRPDGSKRIVLKTVTTLFCESKKYYVENFIDVTHLKDQEAALQKVEKELLIRNRIANIFITMPNGEMYGAVLGVVLEALQSKYGIFGYIDETGDMIAPSMTRDVWDQCKMENKTMRFPRDCWAGIWGQAMIQKKTLFSNNSMNVPAGHIPMVRVISTPIVHDSELIGVFSVANKETDYTDEDIKLLEMISNKVAPLLHARLQRDKAIKELTQSEQKYRQLFEYSPVGIYEVDFINNRFTDVNEVMCYYLGYTKEEFLKTTPFAILTPESQQRFALRLQKLLDGEPVEPVVEYSVVGKNKQAFWVLLNIQYRKDEEGNIVSAHVVANDITKLKETQFRLIREKEKTQLYLDLAPAIFVVLDPEANIIMMNNFGRDLLKIEGDPTKESWESFFISEEDKAFMRDELANLFRGKKDSISCEIRMVTRTNSLIDIIWTCKLIRKGDELQALCAGDDITAEKNATRELNKIWESQIQRLTQSLDNLSLLSEV